MLSSALLLSGHLDFLMPFAILLMAGVGSFIGFVAYKSYQLLQSVTTTRQVVGAFLLNVLGIVIMLTALIDSKNWGAPAMVVVVVLDSCLLIKAFILLQNPIKAAKITGIIVLGFTTFSTYISVEAVQYSARPNPVIQEQGLGETPTSSEPFKWE